MRLSTVKWTMALGTRTAAKHPAAKLAATIVAV
jgi:hypothetical protein